MRRFFSISIFIFFSGCYITISLPLKVPISVYKVLGEIVLAKLKGTKWKMGNKLSQNMKMVKVAIRNAMTIPSKILMSVPILTLGEREKWRVLKNFCKLNPEKNIKYYLNEMVKIEQEVRDYYSDRISYLDTKRFCEMLLKDSVWIFSILCSAPQGNLLEKTTNSVDINMKMGRDLFLFENQIPFFVVERIGELIGPEIIDPYFAAKQAAIYVENYLEGLVDVNWYNKSNRPAKFNHFLHLCHLYLKPENFANIPISHNLTRTVKKHISATRYNEAGVTFEIRKFGSNLARSFLDINYQKGKVQIPFFEIDHKKADLLKNLIMFEYLNPMDGNYVSAYFEFMSGLIREKEDVLLLERKGIILNKLGDYDEVVGLFGCLSRKIIPNTQYRCYLDATYEKLQARYNNRILTSISVLGRKSCGVCEKMCAVVVPVVTIFGVVITYLSFHHTLFGLKLVNS